MGIEWIIMAILGAVIGAAGTGIATHMTNDANLQATRETNETNSQNVQATNDANLQAVRETNAANVQQAELAYQRSLPINQARDLMNAGMSRAGALNKLAGGGTYTAPALSTANLGASNAQAPRFDYSALGDAFERISNVPSNVMQYQQTEEHIKNMRLDSELKVRDDLRKQEDHMISMWEKNYGKKAAEMIDSFSSRIYSLAADKGIDIDAIDSPDKLVKAFNLKDDKEWRDMPFRARTQVFDALKLRADEKRANDANERARIASDDSHRNSLIEQAMKAAQFNEYEITQVQRLELLAQQIAQGKLTISKENYEKVLRDAGFDNKKEAAESIALVEKLRAREQKNEATSHLRTSSGVAGKILMALDWSLDKVNPIKAMLK